MIGIIIQARTQSNRFPRKIYQDICGKYTLQRVLEGVKESKLAQKIILAMPEYDEVELLERRNKGELSEFTDNRFNMYFGSPDDLVDRYFDSARGYGIDLIVRITADCPMVQGKIIDEMLREYLSKKYNGFMSNLPILCDLPHPDGLGIEIFPYWMIAEVNQLTADPRHREHVTTFMYEEGGYKLYNFRNAKPNTLITTKIKDFSFDTAEDYLLLQKICYYYDKDKNLNKALCLAGEIPNSWHWEQQASRR